MSAAGVQAIVAIRPIALGKQRLASVLADDARQALIVAMLEDVLAATAEATRRGTIASTRVAGGDRITDAFAARYGALTMRDAGTGFTAAVAGGIAAAQADAAGAVLVLPADLPLIDADAIDALLRLRPAGPALVIAPDRHGIGSNAVLLTPPGAMPLRFDGASFEPHCAAGRARGLATVVATIAALALDIDELDDLQALADHPLAGRSRAGAVARAIVRGIRAELA